jgi:hypothetical protein
MLLSLASVAAAATTMVAVANASRADATAAPGAITTPMTLVHVTKVVGGRDSAGHVSVLLSNGKIISILAAHKGLVMRHAAATAVRFVANPVYGNCGYSYIYMNHKSNGQPVHMDTGFEVNHAAVEYSWSAHEAGFSGSGYDYSYHASGNLNFRNGWHGQHASGNNYPHGVYAGSVNAGSSWALLDTGGVCFSGGPYESVYL